MVVRMTHRCGRLFLSSEIRGRILSLSLIIFSFLFFFIPFPSIDRARWNVSLRVTRIIPLNCDR